MHRKLLCLILCFLMVFSASLADNTVSLSVSGPESVRPLNIIATAGRGRMMVQFLQGNESLLRFSVRVAVTGIFLESDISGDSILYMTWDDLLGWMCDRFSPDSTDSAVRRVRRSIRDMIPEAIAILNSDLTAAEALMRFFSISAGSPELSEYMMISCDSAAAANEPESLEWTIRIRGNTVQHVLNDFFRLIEYTVDHLLPNSSTSPVQFLKTSFIIPLRNELDENDLVICLGRDATGWLSHLSITAGRVLATLDRMSSESGLMYTLQLGTHNALAFTLHRDGTMEGSTAMFCGLNASFHAEPTPEGTVFSLNLYSDGTIPLLSILARRLPEGLTLPPNLEIATPSGAKDLFCLPQKELSVLRSELTNRIYQMIYTGISLIPLRILRQMAEKL